MNQKILAFVNALALGIMLFVNYYSQAGGINSQTVGELSARYENLFTPAGYAFAIWGMIFLGLIAYVVYQFVVIFKYRKSLGEYEKTGYWLALVNLANASWVIAWLYEYTGLSVLIMGFILIGLLTIVVKTNMERWDAPLSTIAFIWWPVCIYVGWISVATIANIAAYLSKLGWDGGALSETAWTIMMIVVAMAVNLYMIWFRCMREFALVGIWALVAIYIRHQEAYQNIAWIALTCALIIGINAAIHGYLNRETNPLKRALKF